MTWPKRVGTKILGSAIAAIDLSAVIFSFLVSFGVTAWVSLVFLNVGFVFVTLYLNKFYKLGIVVRPALALYSLIYLFLLATSFAVSIFMPLWLWPINLIFVVIGTASLYIVTLATQHQSEISTPRLFAEKNGYAFTSNTAKTLQKVEYLVTESLVERITQVREQIQYSSSAKMAETDEIERKISGITAELLVLAGSNNEVDIRKSVEMISDLMRTREETIRRNQ
jgi:hypothetical protein